MTANTLVHFPMISQLKEATSDGQPDNNAQENCGPAILAAAVEFLTGKAENGDDLKDAAYGPNYTGPTAIPEFAGVLARRGVTLQTVDGDPDHLIATVHREVEAGHPTIMCIPSHWNKEPPDPAGVGYLHFVIAYGQDDDAHTITCMNPWGGFVQGQGDDWWKRRLRLHAVWVLAKAVGAAVGGVPAGWHDDGTTLLAPHNTHALMLAMRAYVLTHPWPASRVPTGAEYYDATGDAYLNMSDGQRLHAVKAKGWATSLEPIPPAPKPAPPLPPTDDEAVEAKALADLKAQVATLQAANLTLTQQVTELRGVVQDLVTMVTVLSGFLTAFASGAKK